MLVTDQAKMIRTTVGDIRIIGRNTQGVTIFRVADDEHVVSVAKIEESDEDEIELEGGDELAPDEGAMVGETSSASADRPGSRRPGATSSGTARRASAFAWRSSPRRNDMALPNQALVLVADGRKMLFLRNHGDENQIDLRTEAHDQREDRKDREIKTDAPGTTKQSFGYGRSTYGGDRLPPAGRGPLGQGRRRRAEEARARAMISMRWRSSPRPRRWACLRKELHKEVERRIVLTLNKEMTDRPIPDIEELLVGGKPRPRPEPQVELRRPAFVPSDPAVSGTDG